MKVNIDRKKHVLYKKSTGKVLLERLTDRFGEEEGQRLWAKANHQYEEWLEGLPYIGATDNFQCHSFYDSIICLAYWDVMPEDNKETVEEFTDTISLMFAGVPFDRKLLTEGKFSDEPGHFPFINCDNTPLLKAVLPVYKRIFAKINRKKARGEWANTWALDIPEDQPKDGIRMRLIGCPVYDFAKAHHFEHLMPAMCNPDFMVFRRLGGEFIRPTVVAQGHPACDQSIVGVHSDLAARATIKTDENGILYSVINDD